MAGCTQTPHKAKANRSANTKTKVPQDRVTINTPQYYVGGAKALADRCHKREAEGSPNLISMIVIMTTKKMSK
jgi:hypothetical protein